MDTIDNNTRICPECGNMADANTNQCPECGYIFESIYKPKNKIEKQICDGRPIISLWLDEAKYRQFVFGKEKYNFPMILTCCSVACMLLLFAFNYIHGQKIILEVLMHLFALVTAFGFSAKSYAFLPCAKWIKKTNLNLKNVILINKQRGISDFNSMLIIYLGNNNKARKIYKLEYALILLCSLICAESLTYILKFYIEEKYLLMIISVLVCIAFIIVQFVVKVKFAVQWSEKVSAWSEKILKAGADATSDDVEFSGKNEGLSYRIFKKIAIGILIVSIVILGITLIVDYTMDTKDLGKFLSSLKIEAIFTIVFCICLFLGSSAFVMKDIFILFSVKNKDNFKCRDLKNEEIEYYITGDGKIDNLYLYIGAQMLSSLLCSLIACFAIVGNINNTISYCEAIYGSSSDSMVAIGNLSSALIKIQEYQYPFGGLIIPLIIFIAGTITVIYLKDKSQKSKG